MNGARSGGGFLWRAEGDKTDTTKMYICDAVFGLPLSGSSWPQEPVTMIIRQGQPSSNPFIILEVKLPNRENKGKKGKGRKEGKGREKNGER